MKPLRVALAVALLCACDAGRPAPAGNLGPAYLAGFGDGSTCCTVIAHAGGAVDGNAYTNSIDAVVRNHALGTRIFELDFVRTSDGHWVAAHDWPYWQRLTGYAGSLPPDRETFSELPLRPPRKTWSVAGAYRALTLHWLEGFLAEHADASIVLDAKEDFEGLVDRILGSEVRDQFVFQAYQISDIDVVKDRDPSARILLTLYRMGTPPGLPGQVAARRGALLGITLPVSWATRPARFERVAATGLPLYLHGGPASINSRALHMELARRGISGFYLD